MPKIPRLSTLKARIKPKLAPNPTGSQVIGAPKSKEKQATSSAVDNKVQQKKAMKELVRLGEAAAKPYVESVKRIFKTILHPKKKKLKVKGMAPDTIRMLQKQKKEKERLLKEAGL